MKHYCYQCNRKFKSGDDIIITDWGVICEDCEADYLRDLKDSWTYTKFEESMEED